MSKSNRAKILSVYLRPLTLSKKIATPAVPFLADLDKGLGVIQQHEPSHEQPSKQNDSIRRAWKGYLTAALPHATRQMRNFMMACVAEGRSHDDEEDLPDS